MEMAQNAMVDQSQLAQTDAMPQPADSVTLLAMSIIGFWSLRSLALKGCCSLREHPGGLSGPGSGASRWREGGKGTLGAQFE
ncbi:hypothetical protein MHYP_G00135790 [Metynnis hypsauchen]